MPLGKRIFTIAAKLAIAIWGVSNIIQGAALSFFIQNDNLAGIYVEVVYGSSIVAALISFVSTSVAILLLLAAILTSVGTLFLSKAWGFGTSDSYSFVEAIALRPGLSLVVLLVVGRLEEKSRLASNKIPS